MKDTNFYNLLINGLFDFGKKSLPVAATLYFSLVFTVTFLFGFALISFFYPDDYTLIKTLTLRCLVISISALIFFLSLVIRIKKRSNLSK